MPACVAALVLAGCTTAAVTADLATPAGQLFCALDAAGGGTFVAAVVQSAAAPLPGAQPVSVLVTGATQAFVQQACSAAARSTGAIAGIPVSPPANPGSAPRVAAILPSF